jgi:hypothetical protein
MLDEITVKLLPPRRCRTSPRGVKRKMSNYPLRRRKGAVEAALNRAKPVICY